MALVLERTAIVIFDFSLWKRKKKENQGQVIPVIVLMMLSGIFLLITGVMDKKTAVKFYDEGLKSGRGIIIYLVLGIVMMAAYLTGLIFQKRK